jgi:hypothetical protein
MVDVIILPRLRLLDGPLVDKDRATIDRMAADLARLGATADEAVAIRALMATRAYGNYQCMLLAPDAIYAARQAAVTTEVTKP